MSSLFHTDPFPTLHSPSSYEDSSPDLSVLQELEMEYGEPVNPLSDEFLTPEQEYTSPLSDASMPTFTITSPYDVIPTPTMTCVKQETTVTHHIPLIPFQSVTATRTAKKRRRFVGMTNLRGSDDDTPVDDNNSVNSSDSLSSQSSPSPPQPKKTKRAKANNDPSMGKRERNKVSASKYRKRRKIYLDTLEERTHELEAKYATQQDTMTAMESENKVLKEQLSFLKNLLNGKGQDMVILEKQLHDGFQSTSNPQQSSSIFMFVLFSCFLLFNPMSWFTSTPNNPMNIPTHVTLGGRPDTTGWTGRKVLHFMDDTVGHEVQYVTFRDEDEIPELSILSMDAAVTESQHQNKQDMTAPMVSVSMAAAHVHMAAPIPTGSAPAPAPATAASTLSASLTVSPDALKGGASYVPLTGAPRHLFQSKGAANIDVDDPIRVHRVAQPVESQAKMAPIAPTAASPQLPMDPTTAAATATMRTIIDLTNTSATDNYTSQHDMHKLAHDQLYVPLVRLMGETQAQHALQQLAQGVMNIQLENQTETRSSSDPQVVPV